jgi:uncharacterized protein (TIGR02246 family)
MVASQETVDAVRGVLDRFAATYAAKDVTGVLDCFVLGKDGVLIGTGADEWRIGDTEIRVQTERDFAQAEALSIDYGDIHIDASDGVAWFAASATMHASVGGEAFEAALRLTGVLTNRADGWKIVQSHLSFPSAAQETGSSF